LVQVSNPKYYAFLNLSLHLASWTTLCFKHAELKHGGGRLVWISFNHIIMKYIYHDLSKGRTQQSALCYRQKREDLACSLSRGQEKHECQNRKQVFVRQEHLTDMLKKAPATTVTTMAGAENYFFYIFLPAPTYNKLLASEIVYCLKRPVSRTVYTLLNLYDWILAFVL
jgi:hypothetical protein